MLILFTNMQLTEPTVFWQVYQCTFVSCHIL